MKALIKVGYGCNENCTFCHTADVRHVEDSADRVAWKIDRAKRLGYSMVVLSGGEPTSRPELLAWARHVAAHGLDFGLVTNGLMLSYPHVTDELVERCRLRYVYMSLHGGDAKVHGSVVRADTFDQAIGALECLAGRVPDLTVNCVVTTANVDHLRGLVDRLLPFRGVTLKFSMTQPKGAADPSRPRSLRVFDVLVPDVEACAAKVKDAIEYGLERRTSEQLRFAHDGIPFCLLPGLEDLYDDLKTHRFAAMIETDEDDFVPVDDVAKVHPEPCDDCSIRGACPGLYRGYWEERGHGALSPVTHRARANSYHFVPERDVARPPGAPCPIKRDGVSPYDRGRTLFVRLRDRMRLFRTETRDFTDAELLAVKEGIGQIYADVSTKLAPDDFAKDLVKLSLSAECTACERRPACTACFEPSGRDRAPGDARAREPSALPGANPFEEDDARVLEILGELEGRVLDLGCGEGRYLPALAARAASGRVDYVGIDPDDAVVAMLAARHPFGRFLAARAEELDETFGVVDHLLVLRSYNHLADPEGAIDRALERLREGGTLTIVDNVAFGLVRTRVHARRAERAAENRFEHYRNDDAGRAARRLEGRPLRLLERRDVGRTTSNQWLLRYERTRPTAP